MQNALGADCFEETGTRYGEFWGALAGRPYLRTLGMIVRLAFEVDDINKAM